MDPSKQRRGAKGYSYRLRPVHVLGLGLFALAAVSLVLLRPRDMGGTYSSRKLAEQHISASVPAAASQVWKTEQHPNPPLHKHTFLILDPSPGSDPHTRAAAGGGSSSGGGDPALAEIRAALQRYRQHPEAVSVVELQGPASLSLAAQFLLTASDLPAIVYLPPMYETGGDFKATAAFALTPQGGREESVTLTASTPRATEEELFSLTLTRGPASAFEPWIKQSARLSLLLEVDWDGVEDVCFYFVRGPGDELQLGCPKPKVEMWQSVGLLDQFVARNKTSNALLAEYTALFSGIFPVHPPNWCRYLVDRNCEIEKYQPITDPEVLESRKMTEEQRVELMVSQPAKEPKFTTIGFKKKRCPYALHLALSGYLNATWGNVMRERRELDNTYANDVEAPTLHAPLPENGDLKKRLFRIVEQELQEWTNRATPLKPTAMYGIRVYSNRSTLAMHVDRWDTHVVSAIINVDQDTDKPWPLQIKDHSGKEHSVLMRPGDMVMYEGAACAHGRVLPLEGRFFANVFVHFQPPNLVYPPPEPA